MAIELERRTLRTATQEIPSTRAISRLLTCCAFSSRIVVRCAWLNMRFLFRRCDGVVFECDRSGAAQLRIADDPALSPPRQPAAAARGSQWRPPSPDHATVR